MAASLRRAGDVRLCFSKGSLGVVSGNTRGGLVGSFVTVLKTGERIGKYLRYEEMETNSPILH